MKNIFKIMGIAVLACGMMVACGNKDNDEDNNNNNNNGGNNQEQQDPDGVSVEFNGTTWTANYNANAYYVQYSAIDFFAAKTTTNEYPLFDNCLYSDQVGTSHDVLEDNGSLVQFGEDNTHAWVEYYEQTTLSDGQSSYGDWWACDATTEIKAIDLTNLTVTAKMNGTMFSAKEAYVDGAGFSGASQAPYKATFKNVTLSEK